MEARMRDSSQALCLAVIALGSLTSVSASHGEDLLRLAPGIAKSVVVEGAAAGKFTSIIGDPKIADFTFGPKNTFWFVGKTEGTTNVIVVDTETARELYSATIEVGGLNLVHIHNKAVLTSYTIYRCTPTCQYVGEVTAAEPAPLPRGYSDISQKVQSSTTQPPSPTNQPQAQ
jgi:hypothetical protein